MMTPLKEKKRSKKKENLILSQPSVYADTNR